MSDRLDTLMAMLGAGDLTASEQMQLHEMLSDSLRQVPDGGMLPDELIPFQKEWYRLCERRFAVERISISGEMAEAIVSTIGRLNPAPPTSGAWPPMGRNPTPPPKPTSAQAGADDREEAPPHNLPEWDECNLRVKNSDYIARNGLEPIACGKYANELHRFINEYDDADRYRSAWFMHRLEKLLDWHANEVRAQAGAELPELPEPAIPADCDGECIHGPYFTTEQMLEFAKRPILSEVERQALQGILRNVEHDAGDTDDLAPSIVDDEDSYWAWHAYHGLTKLLARRGGSCD